MWGLAVSLQWQHCHYGKKRKEGNKERDLWYILYIRESLEVTSHDVKIQIVWEKLS